MHALLKNKTNSSIQMFIDASNIGSGGGISHLKNLLERAPLDKKCYTIWVDKSFIKILPKKENFTYKTSIFFKLSAPMKIFWKIFIFRTICFFNKPDVIFCPGGLLFFKHPNSVINFQNILPFVDLTNDSAGFFEIIKNNILRRLLFFSASSSTKHIFHSHNSKKIIYSHNLESKKNSVIYHGIDNEFLIEKSRFQQRIEQFEKKMRNREPLNFSYVSSAYKYKNHTQLLEIFVALKKKSIPYNLNLIISDGPFKKNILKTIHDFQLRDKVTIFENLDKKNLISILHDETDIGLFVSSFETFGIILAEKMASGLPIFCTKSSCIPEILENHNLYLDLNDIDSSVDKILNDLNDVEKIIYNCNSSLIRAKEFSWENSAKMSWDFILSK